MHPLLSQSMRATLAVLLLLGLAISMATGSRMAALPERLQFGVVALVGLAVLFAVLLRRVRGEDRIAGLEAALCREQNARTQADQALAESDLLLERLTARGRGRGAGVATAADPIAQLAAIQAELMQLRQVCASDDPLLASRIDLLCTRVACVARAVNVGHTVESG